jgi:hypothetical protein
LRLKISNPPVIETPFASPQFFSPVSLFVSQPDRSGKI